MSRALRQLAVLVAVFAATLPVCGRATAADGAPRVHVELVSEVAAVAPGATFWVGLRQEIAPGWHTYWLKPGRLR